MPGRSAKAGIGLFLFGATSLLWAQANLEANPPQDPEKSSPASPAPDLSQAYYHYMLARRYRELAGIYNRGDYLEKAISEFKLALQADPESHFLRVELAELYWRGGRLADAVRDAEAVLKVDPDHEGAHRLLANLYVRNLGDFQGERVAKESLNKAIEHFEALVRIKPADTESLLALGRLYRHNNQSAKAEEIFKKVLEGAPDSRNAVGFLAQLYFDQGEPAEAIELLKKVPEDDRDAPLHGMLAYAYTQLRDYDNALAFYEKALTQDGDNQELRRSYAEALMAADQGDQARAELEKVLKADPEDGTTHLRLAQLDRQEGRFDEARKELEQARTLLPGNLEVSYQLVQLEETLGNHDRAIEILEDLLKKTANSLGESTPAEANNRAIFLERKGVIHRTQEKHDLALNAFEELSALGPNFGARGEGLIIETLRLSRQPQKALERSEAALQKYPRDRAVRLLRASVLGERGRVDEALELLRQMLNGTPADREIHLATAQTTSQARRFAEAEAAVQEALAMSPKSEDQEYARFLLGSIYERQKKYDLAEEEFKKVLSSNPLHAPASNYLGYMLADRGVRLDESVRHIQKALKLEPNNGAYLDSLGWAYYKMKRYDLAEGPLEKAARLVGDDPTIHDHLGHLYLQMGKRQQAREAWERALKEWPNSLSSEFDAEQAARLQKQLDELKLRPSKEKSARK